MDLSTSPEGTATGRPQADTTDYKVSVTTPMADACQINAAIIDAETVQGLADSQTPA
ncbi:hypothetical protein [Streptomyces dysideae]|uniref:hypothetical protein n=1 Tax=Streptomyces dysideae TaxID=909626 RepID=UPI000A80EEBD|nr:hypothetical protein [Streptomyces dysideae]